MTSKAQEVWVRFCCAQYLLPMLCFRSVVLECHQHALPEAYTLFCLGLLRFQYGCV